MFVKVKQIISFRFFNSKLIHTKNKNHENNQLNVRNFIRWG